MVAKTDAVGAGGASVRVDQARQDDAGAADAALATPAAKATALEGDTVDTTTARRSATELTAAPSGAVAPAAPGAAPTKPAGDQGMGAVMNSLGKLMDKAADVSGNWMVQGGLAIGSSITFMDFLGASLGSIVSAVGCILSLCQFMSSMMKEGGKPDWVALAQTILYGLGVFIPGVGAFGGLVGMVNGAMSSGKDVVAPGTPRTGVAQTA